MNGVVSVLVGVPSLLGKEIVRVSLSGLYWKTKTGLFELIVGKAASKPIANNAPLAVLGRREKFGDIDT